MRVARLMLMSVVTVAVCSFCVVTPLLGIYRIDQEAERMADASAWLLALAGVGIGTLSVVWVALVVVSWFVLRDLAGEWRKR